LALKPTVLNEYIFSHAFQVLHFQTGDLVQVLGSRANSSVSVRHKLIWCSPCTFDGCHPAAELAEKNIYLTGAGLYGQVQPVYWATYKSICLNVLCKSKWPVNQDLFEEGEADNLGRTVSKT